MACHTVTFQAAAEDTLHFGCFPANVNISLAFATRQAANNMSLY